MISLLKLLKCANHNSCVMVFLVTAAIQGCSKHTVKEFQKMFGSKGAADDFFYVAKFH